MDMLTFFDLVQNPAKYKAKLDELDAAEQRYLAAVAAHGAASEMVSLRDKARLLLEEAKSKVEKMLGMAEQDIKASKQKAQQDAAAAQVAKAEAEANVQKAKSNVEATAAALAEAEQHKAKAMEVSVKVEQHLTDLQEKHAEVDERLDKLRRVMQ